MLMLMVDGGWCCIGAGDGTPQDNRLDQGSLCTAQPASVRITNNSTYTSCCCGCCCLRLLLTCTPYVHLRILSCVYMHVRVHCICFPLPCLASTAVLYVRFLPLPHLYLPPPHSLPIALPFHCGCCILRVLHTYEGGKRAKDLSTVEYKVGEGPTNDGGGVWKGLEGLGLPPTLAGVICFGYPVGTA